MLLKTQVGGPFSLPYSRLAEMYFHRISVEPNSFVLFALRLSRFQ